MITSRQNSKVTQFRALMRDRKARLEAGLFAVEGEKLFHEAISSGLKPQDILVTKKNSNFCQIAANLCNIDIISDDLAEYISDTKSPQGVFFSLPLLDKFSNMSTIYNSVRLIALDGVQNPGNVGAIIRSCDAFGIDALLLSETCADIHSPKVIRSAMGSAFRLPIYRGEIADLKDKGFTIIGAALPTPEKSAEKLGSFEFPEKCAVIIGSEGAGISAEILNICDKKLYIPIKNAESLNAAVAASIIIYEMRKQFCLT
jgi:TrmH family RNA methyltransferase